MLYGAKSGRKRLPCLTTDLSAKRPVPMKETITVSTEISPAPFKPRMKGKATKSQARELKVLRWVEAEDDLDLLTGGPSRLGGVRRVRFSFLNPSARNPPEVSVSHRDSEIGPPMDSRGTKTRSHR
ncbi:hypothetical protein EYF80_050047 [Liparis tanakae]|uniref:Uncharacterized protein n=1 Tax=Liparis tanakae TaxID=230148 RepID=A0A4Z2FF45_9TELE|nr:hypothetical protein EYF80_050047 [Liparis tanakae]